MTLIHPNKAAHRQYENANHTFQPKSANSLWEGEITAALSASGGMSGNSGTKTTPADTT